MAQIRTVIGLMSGTSMDGIDVALLATDGTVCKEFGPFETYPYDDADRGMIAGALVSARATSDRKDRSPPLDSAETMITERHSQAVERFITDFSIDRQSIDAIGFHGQTVFHDPGRALTIQIGDGQELADQTGIPVVWDMRADDMAAGGQGAPLAPVFHRALAEAGGLVRPAAFLNIGGVANITWIGPEGELVAFDCGPGNALLDDWIRINTGERYDRDGAAARAGAEPDADILNMLLKDEYFERPPPKSLDRDHFSVPGLADLSVADGARLLTRFSAEAVSRGASVLPGRPELWVATGGGRHNTLMMEMLAGVLEGDLMTAEDCGFNGDAIEAQAFAFLAVRHLEALPLTFPGTTGIRRPLNGGRVSRPRM